MIDILATLIPVCPNCRRVLRRVSWAKRPQATCYNCGRSYFYSPDGRIILSAKLRKAA